MKWSLFATSLALRSLADTVVVNSSVTGINQALVDLFVCVCVSDRGRGMAVVVVCVCVDCRI